jgi:hypothetical protein
MVFVFNNTLFLICIGSTVSVIIFYYYYTQYKTEKFSQDVLENKDVDFANELAIYINNTRPTFIQYLLHLTEHNNKHTNLVDKQVYSKLMFIPKIDSKDILLLLQ